MAQKEIFVGRNQVNKKNLEFLREMKERMQKKDYEFVEKMILDWINDLVDEIAGPNDGGRSCKNG